MASETSGVGGARFGLCTPLTNRGDKLRLEWRMGGGALAFAGKASFSTTLRFFFFFVSAAEAFAA